MRVKSVFISLFCHPLVMRFATATVMIAIFFMASAFTTHPNHELRAKQVNLIIREIGHRLLLQAGDSTSRVLPVKETGEGTFSLQFENEFAFSHDSLMVLAQALLPETRFDSGYTVTVHDCMKTAIVYGFQLNKNSPDILPCRGRREPAGCYIIEFSFPGFNESEEPAKADVEQLAETEQPRPVKVVARNINPKSEKTKAITPNNDIDQLTEALKLFKVASQEANPKAEEFKTTTSDYSITNFVYSGLLVLIGVALLIGRFGKLLTPAPLSNQARDTIKESIPELANLGKFLFDVKGNRLLLENEVISLTDKECKILELLNTSFGELVPRETLLQKVWIDEGVITSRSLDMFVSRLRKKLSGDGELRITNVHGKGYKLEVARNTDLIQRS
jgi:DNA-binding winged helix-turn-helix (wHTH) protein